MQRSRDRNCLSSAAVLNEFTPPDLIRFSYALFVLLTLGAPVFTTSASSAQFTCDLIGRDALAILRMHISGEELGPFESQTVIQEEAQTTGCLSPERELRNELRP